jgi:hypothetical protein
MTVFIVFIKSFSKKIVFKKKKLNVQLTVLPQAEAKGSQQIQCTSRGHRLKQHSGFQRFVSDLLVAYDPLISARNWAASSINM